MKIFKTEKTCAKEIGIEVDGDIIKSIKFFGGCDGNTQAIENLVAGMKINDVIDRLTGINCNGKGTSCPDQLVKILKENFCR